jgi:pterin-4a-carbinolamine dehydratase
MPAEKVPYLFISYRRQDTQWIARALYRHLSEGFGAHHIFMDRIEIRGGDQWKSKIDDALQKSTAVLVIIGPQWLDIYDNYRRLRIDNENDWVRTEIRVALNHRKLLIPLYVDGADLITDPRHLPGDIQGLIDSQGIVLNENNWDAGLYDLVRRFRANGFESYQTTLPMPERRKKVEPLSASLLVHELRKLPGWQVTSSSVSVGIGDTPVTRTELYKEFRFATFSEATHFMAFASAAIVAGNHNPRWENFWTTVRVWLCTWDIEFQPSHYDLTLAHTLDQQYLLFQKTN